MIPVSYTHLDVYKRQEQTDRLRKVQDELFTLKETNSDLKLELALKPVSYTHLDVYKRQDGDGLVSPLRHHN